MVLYLAMVFFVVVFFYAEMVNAKKLNIPLLSILRNKYMLLFLASIFLFMVTFICEKMPWEDAFPMLAAVVSSLFAGYFLSVYILFRGLLLVLKVSREGEEHPTCQSIRKLIKRPWVAYTFLFVCSVIAHAGPIYGLWVLWNLSR